jgi:flagellar hook-associated protein 2
MSTSSTALATFNGTSQYAGSLQNTINQAVTIASGPMNQLSTSVATLQGQSIELNMLQTDFSAIQTAIQSLSTASGTGSLSASVTDSTIASATIDPTQAVAAGTYTLNVKSIGSPTSTLSNTGLPTVADPATSSISSASSFTLTVGTSTYTITPSGNTLNALAQAINSSGAAVNASIVNIGPPSAPDYRLSVQSTALGETAIQLNGGTNLLGVLSEGSVAQYQVDGQPSTPISSDSSTVEIAPGVSIDLLAPGETTVLVSSDPSAPATALSSLVTAYNAAVQALDQNHGTAGGALTGNSLLISLEQSLQQITRYSASSGSVQSLSDLGLTFDQTGQLSFNQSQFESVSASDPGDVAAFLGSASGGGFLGLATNVLNGLDNSTNGVFEQASATVQQQITSDNQQISTDQTNITTLQNNLVAQMDKADAAISALESQVSYFTGLFQDSQNDLQANTLG